MARLRARTYAYLIGIGTPILLAGVLWWFRRQGGPAAPSDQLFALVVGAAMLGTAGILLKRSLPTLGASLALLVLGFPQEILGMVILPSGGLYLIAAFIVGLTDVGEMVGEGIEAGKEGMEESGMNAPEMPSAFQDATDGGETESAADAEQTVPDAEAPDTPEQPVPDAEAPEGPAQPVDAEDVEPITAEADAGAEADADADTRADADGDADAETDEDVPDPEEVVEEHGPHHAPEVQVDQNRMHADDPSVGQIDGDTGEAEGDSDSDTDESNAGDPDETTDEIRESADGEPDADETATGTPVERSGPAETLEDQAEGDDADEESVENADGESRDDADEDGAVGDSDEDTTSDAEAADEEPETDAVETDDAETNDRDADADETQTTSDEPRSS
jgi:hypothetical protein